MKHIHSTHGKKIGKGCDCGIIVIANLFDLTYNYTILRFKQYCNYNYFNDIGVTNEDIIKISNIICKIQKKEIKKKKSEKIKIEEFCNKYSNGVFLVFFESHVECVINGNLYSQLCEKDFKMHGYNDEYLFEIYQIIKNS